jgi:hypothetical protein
LETTPTLLPILIRTLHNATRLSRQSSRRNPIANRFEAIGSVGDNMQEFDIAKWFVEKAYRSLLESTRLNVAILMACHNDNGQLWLGLFYFLEQLEPVHAGHAHVCDKASDLALIAGIEEILGGEESFGRKSGRFEKVADRNAYSGVIVYNRDCRVDRFGHKAHFNNMGGV